MAYDVVILGAGITGLSTAFHLGEGYAIFEAEPEVGGLARSMQTDGFTFDYSGHVFHVRDPGIEHWVSGSMPGVFQRKKREAWIFSKGVYTRYPFQAHFYGLPKEVVKECLLGFIHTLNGKVRSDPPETFEDWILRYFGEGIAKHFMIPYNRKLWRIPLREMSTEWASRYIPRPGIEEVIDGSLGITDGRLGYNSTFLYPREGGMIQLARIFEDKIRDLYLSRRAVKISTDQKAIFFSDGSIQHYSVLVSTLPLPELIKLIADIPGELSHMASELKYVSVHTINLGVERPGISEKHWIYFPEEAYLFYRIGFPMNFSRSMAPEGTSSMYVDISHRPDEAWDEQELSQRVLYDLYAVGILSKNDRILTEAILHIEYAYVLYDAYRAAVLPLLKDYLASRDIYSIGRYGSWAYSSLEDCILEGKKTAQEIVSRLEGRRSQVHQRASVEHPMGRLASVPV